MAHTTTSAPSAARGRISRMSSTSRRTNTVETPHFEKPDPCLAVAAPVDPAPAAPLPGWSSLPPGPPKIGCQTRSSEASRVTLEGGGGEAAQDREDDGRGEDRAQRRPEQGRDLEVETRAGEEAEDQRGDDRVDQAGAERDRGRLESAFGFQGAAAEAQHDEGEHGEEGVEERGRGGGQIREIT